MKPEQVTTTTTTTTTDAEGRVTTTVTTTTVTRVTVGADLPPDVDDPLPPDAATDDWDDEAGGVVGGPARPAGVGSGMTPEGGDDEMGPGPGGD